MGASPGNRGKRETAGQRGDLSGRKKVDIAESRRRLGRETKEGPAERTTISLAREPRSRGKGVTFEASPSTGGKADCLEGRGLGGSREGITT